MIADDGLVPTSTCTRRQTGIAGDIVDTSRSKMIKVEFSGGDLFSSGSMKGAEGTQAGQQKWRTKVQGKRSFSHNTQTKATATAQAPGSYRSY